MNVSTDELRRAALLLFKHLEDTDQGEWSLAEDFYWEVPRDSRYDPYTKPTELTLGQLSDDLREVRRMLDDESEPLGYALVWLAAILRRVGEKAIG